MLTSLLNKREKLRHELQSIEKQVYELKIRYLQESSHIGNALKGFERFLSSSKSIARNYPLLMAVLKVTPSLAAGCTAVLKPSKLASVTCLELADICREVGLPPGVLNVLTRLGSEAGAPLASHPSVDKIVFTGSFATGSNVMTAVAQLVEPVSMELGGKSPLIVECWI